MATDRGWLVGRNLGEWGSGVWFTADGEHFELLSNWGSRAFIRVGDDVVALIGGAHFVAHGAVTVLRYEQGVPSLELVVDLGVFPGPHVVEPDGSVLVVTTEGLFRIRPGPAVEWVVRSPAHGLYPNSMVRTDQGVVYVGMRRAVQRHVPYEDGYVSDWLVPESCPYLRRLGAGHISGCLCAQAPGPEREE